MILHKERKKHTAQKKAVCFIRIWGVFNWTYFFWIPFSTRQVCVQIVCATFYPSDHEFPCDTKIVLEIWDVSSKLKWNCYHSDGTWPKLQLLAVLLQTERLCRISHYTAFVLKTSLSLHEVEEGAWPDPGWSVASYLHRISQRKIGSFARLLSNSSLFLNSSSTLLSSLWQWYRVLWILSNVIGKAV